MKIAIVYATREGQTRKIAQYLAGAIRAREVEVEVFDLAETANPDLGPYGALVVAGSVHIGSHERELVRFVRQHRADLERVPSAFISVSLAQAAVEGVMRAPDLRAQARRDVAATLDAFFRKSGWHPEWVQPVAGALRYTQYNFLNRQVMRMISKREGGSTDTSQDHEYTDWVGLERFTEKLLQRVSARAESAPV
jgi:menaquinone-dependent protoporphyrinogen oxidase